MKKSSTLALLLSVLMLACPFTSCTAASDRDNPSNTEVSGEAVEKPKILTNVFRGTQISLPEDYSLNSNIVPVYNIEKIRNHMLLHKL